MEPIQEQNPVMNPEQNQQSYMPGTALPMLTFGQAIKEAFSKYATLKGRSRRSEYWWFSLFGFILALVFFLPAIIVGLNSPSGEPNMTPGLIVAGLLALFGALAMLVLVIPSITLQVRRLHDVGRSGWWMVWSVVVAIVFECVAFAILGLDYSDMGFFEEYNAAFAVSALAGVVLSLLGLVNMAISIALFVFSLLDSHKEANKYGPSPKYV